jgi:uncharacterized membrane protein YjgN (DUF898 family)
MADTCPKCGLTGVDADRCPGCGVVIPTYRLYLEKLRQGPRRPGAPAPARAAADAAASPREAAGSPVASTVGASAGPGWSAAASDPATAPASNAGEAAPGATPPGGEAGPAASATGGVRPSGFPSSLAAEAAGAMSGRRRLTFHGSGGTLLGMQIVNALLTLVTAGVFYFWGRVRIRKYLYGQTELGGDRFEYHGTGKELFVGFVKAVLIFGVPLVAVNAVPELLEAGPVVRGVAGLLGYAIVLTFVAVALVGARRYRLSRTSWRGIRFSFRGHVGDFVRLFVTGSLLSALTFGIYTPVFMVRQYEYLTVHSYFGSRKFGFDGERRALLWPYVKALLLALPTLGLYGFWYLAQQQRYLWNHTTFAGARFRSTVTGGGLLWLIVSNLLLLAVTLGLAWPWTVVRKIRYRLDHLSLDGPLDLAGIVQDARSAGATAEAVGGFLDLDLSVG